VELRALGGEYAVCRLPSGSAPAPDYRGGLLSITVTPDEVSVVCPVERAPAGATIERGWSAYVVAGPLDFSLTGVLASLAQPLAEAGVPVFAVSTYDTDYLLVRSTDRDRAEQAWRQAGHLTSAG